METYGTPGAQDFNPELTVTITNAKCSPWTLLRVEANGRLYFANTDDTDYRLTLSKSQSSAATDGVAVVLPAKSTVTLIINEGQDAYYGLSNLDGTGELGGGPIKGGPHK
jgi:type 1 fimbria pilin